MLLLTAFCTPGCYLSHVAAGQLDLLRSSAPIAQILGDPATSDATRAGLELVVAARRFAVELGLEVDGQYTHFAEWPGDRLVTTLVATRPGALDPSGFWFPIVGRVPYKGFFERERAGAEARALREQGYDVCVSPVVAYSTLGWFADPVTGPMLRQGPGRLVETVIHELVHANIYTPSQAEWNESIATYIGEEARVAFFTRREGVASGALHREQVAVARAYRAVLEDTRQRLVELYEDGSPDPEREARRGAILAAAREQIGALPLRDSQWAAQNARLNDACLALAGTYAAHLERYASLMEERALDLPVLVRLAREAAASESPVESLEALASGRGATLAGGAAHGASFGRTP